jgi:hypothetical protein
MIDAMYDTPSQDVKVLPIDRDYAEEKLNRINMQQLKAS